MQDYKVDRDAQTDKEVANRCRCRDIERPASWRIWRVSITSISEAPVFGHGTGSDPQLFSREAEGKSGEWGNIIRNPQTRRCYVAIQWGVLGCLVPYAMWYFHLQLFRGSFFASWIGLVIVVQNFISSLLNSHLFDFHEGWVYVLGVGVAAVCGRARS